MDRYIYIEKPKDDSVATKLKSSITPKVIQGFKLYRKTEEMNHARLNAECIFADNITLLTENLTFLESRCYDESVFSRAEQCFFTTMVIYYYYYYYLITIISY